ncbi:hypothetical protein HPB49_007863 [Dermacentor silvarum]|uniref:Uncharacterized protein n=1 Tax=Dermacentor silvarum TaxID=543639 RepID=A0ACB8CQP7_DERSI|nr:hypothetical protein HPB49_007863 [Dermacentor silvarum]
MPGADRIVRHLHVHGIPMAVATFSKRASFDLKMTRHQDLLALFHHVVCSSEDPEVNRSKPHPDIFLIAASRFDEKILSEKVACVHRLVRHLHARGVPITNGTSSKPASLDLKLPRDRDFLVLVHHLDCSGVDPLGKPSKLHSDTVNVTASKFVEKTASEEVGEIYIGKKSAERNAHWRGPSRSANKRDETCADAPEGTLPSFKSVSHVLFDLDGLLLDTEKLYTHAAERVASRYGKTFTWELNRRVLGTPDTCAARTIVEILGLPLTPDEFLKEVDRMCEEVYHTAQLMPGAERLLRHLHAHGIPMAVATSSTPASFTLKMTQHQDIVALFHHVVCSGGDSRVKRGKPHPDIFLVAASKFVDTPPSEKVLVFEDSPMGVTAALAAGMQVVMVPDPRIDEENRRRATLCIVSLIDFKPELFGLPYFNTSPQKN